MSDEEESFDTQLIRRNFSEAFEEYRNKILEYQSSNSQDPSINRAMIAMTKTLRRSMKCLPAQYSKLIGGHAPKVSELYPLEGVYAGILATPLDPTIRFLVSILHQE